ncbi:ABC transporter permease [Halosquirtibacter laminarini]|uniref:ABC transporter permease n=1 Tax=Halosquirtibacter laminarini TaxID=3374600 RepID=A0AC61NHR0_9BACT|nr:ABC transporter permease [Prolixibacteraceae bacterium]
MKKNILQLISISWRNIWRNKVRSAVVISAMAIGMFAAIFASSLATGLIVDKVKEGIEVETSYIQVHAPKFREDLDLHLSMPWSEKRQQEIMDIPGVDAVSPRYKMSAMASTTEAGRGVEMLAVDPTLEKETSTVASMVTDGVWLDQSKRRNRIVIGKKLAEKLKVKLKSKVVLSFQDIHGDIVGAAFRVVGIYNTTDSRFEEQFVYVKNKDIQRIASLDKNKIQEIAIHISDGDQLDAIKSEVVKKFPNQEVMDWKEISPELGYSMEMSSFYMFIFVMIILFALGFGIVNTMMMVVLERVREFGILMAIGMQRAKVFWMVIFESVWLCLTGGVVGIILSMIAIGLTRDGIHVASTAEGFEAMGYSSVIRPYVEMHEILLTVLMVVVAGILAAIIPARKALKNNPCESIRTI